MAKRKEKKTEKTSGEKAVGHKSGKPKLKKVSKVAQIIIDEAKGLIFSSEEEIYNHFVPRIEELEKEYQDFRAESDINETKFNKHEFYLTQVLQNPDEVWLSNDIIQNNPIGTFIGEFEDDDSVKFTYVALTYFVNDMPRFVFLHFPTKDQDLVAKYKRGLKIFEKGMQSRVIKEVAVDALSEGDEYAVALYQTMLKLRSKNDVREEQFPDFLKFREPTIENPDEVWKFIDSQGQVLVRFIKNISEDETLYYIITTLEEEASESQYLLFSFPTNDINLVERYRQGECLEATSYTREESH